MKWLVLGATLSCSTTINIKNYRTDCDASDQCERIVVGNICSCACQLGAINVIDDSKYTNDLETIGPCETTCVDLDGGADATWTCGEGIGARCVSGTCATYVLPVDGGAD